MTIYHHIGFNELSLACCAPTTPTVALLTFYKQSWHCKKVSPLTEHSCLKDKVVCTFFKGVGAAKAGTHLEVREHAHSFSSFSASLLSGLEPRPMTPISECGRAADRLVNIHEKATSLMIPTCSERWRVQRKWPLTGHRETQRAWALFSVRHSEIVGVSDSYIWEKCISGFYFKRKKLCNKDIN